MNHRHLIPFLLPAVLIVAAVVAGIGMRAAAGAPDAGNAPQGQYLSATPVDVMANDLLHDATRDVIYASIPSSGGANGNSIAPIGRDGEVGEAVFVGSEPNVLARSDDGRYLYVGIDGAGAFRRVDLTDGSVGPLWSLGSDSCGLYTARDMVGLSGEPDAVALSRGGGCNSQIAVYDNGVTRPDTIQSFYGIEAIEPSGGPGTLYGYARESPDSEFHVLSTSVDGITRTQTVDGLITGYTADIHYAAGRVYATDGRVVDPATLTLAGAYAAQGPLAVDVAAGVIYFAAGDIFSGPAQLRAFDLDTFLPLYSATLPNFDGIAVVELIALDGDEFVIRLSDNRVFLLQLTEGSAASGRVTDPNGYGLPGVVITDEAGHSATTDYMGDYTLAPLADGTHTLTPVLDGYVFNPPSIEITTPPDATGQDFSAAPTPTVWGLCLPVVTNK